jgi:hypothetical protein
MHIHVDDIYIAELKSKKRLVFTAVCRYTHTFVDSFYTQDIAATHSGVGLHIEGAGGLISGYIHIHIQVDDIYSEELKPEERPACIAVVDVSGSEEFVEIARSGVYYLCVCVHVYMYVCGRCIWLRGVC